MIARLTQWRARPELSREEALAAWLRHADVVERVPGLQRYVQNHAVVAPDGSEPPYAGLGEAWFENVRAARLALESPEWRAVIDDASAFMDLETVVAAWVERRLVYEPE